MLVRCCQYIDAKVLLDGYWDGMELPMRGGVNVNNSLVGKSIREIVDSCRKLQIATYGKLDDHPSMNEEKYHHFTQTIEAGGRKRPNEQTIRFFIHISVSFHHIEYHFSDRSRQEAESTFYQRDISTADSMDRPCSCFAFPSPSSFRGVQQYPFV